MSHDLLHTLKKLRIYRDTSFPILSLYIPISEVQQLKQKTLEDIFHILICRSLSKKQKKELFNQLFSLDTYIHKTHQLQDLRGIAFFVGSNNLWEVVYTPFPLPPHIIVSHVADVKPLEKELATYHRFLVIVVDRQKATCFTLLQGVIENQTYISKKDVTQQFKGRGARERTGKVDRHILDHLERHFAFVTTKLADFIHNQPIHGVIVGGHADSIHLFENHLPQNLKDRIIGEFSAEPDTSMNELLEKSTALAYH